jgi:uncharacterized membrane protein (UPF0127 family)
MRVAKAVHLKTGEVCADQVGVATTFYQRTRGLLGRAAVKNGEGLYIPRCKSIHTFFMRFPIDVLFLDKDNAVTRMIPCLVPFRIAVGPWPTSSVLELQCGTLAEGRFDRGDTISFLP